MIAKEHKQNAIAAAARAEAQSAAEMARAHFLPRFLRTCSNGGSSLDVRRDFHDRRRAHCRRKFESDNTLGDLLNYVCAYPRCPSARASSWRT